MQSKFETLQINLLCDEEVGRVTLPKVAIESLATAAVPTLKSIILIGGKDGGYRTNTHVYEYDPLLQKWSMIPVDSWDDIRVWPRYLGASYSYATPLMNGSVLFAINRANHVDDRVVIFGPAKNPSIHNAHGFDVADEHVRKYMCRTNSQLATLHDGRVVCVGGYRSLDNNLGNNIITTYDPVSFKCTKFEINQYFNDASCVVTLSSGELLICGGLTRNNTSASWDSLLVDPNTLVVKATKNMKTPRFCHAGCLLEDGRALVHGGGSGVGFARTYEIYDPTMNEWTEFRPIADGGVSSLNWDRTNHMCVQLPDKKIFISGDGTRHRCLLLDLPTNILTQTAIPPNGITGYLTIPVYE
jgi:hypothetical protein